IADEAYQPADIDGRRRPGLFVMVTHLDAPWSWSCDDANAPPTNLQADCCARRCGALLRGDRGQDAARAAVVISEWIAAERVLPERADSAERELELVPKFVRIGGIAHAKIERPAVAFRLEPQAVFNREHPAAGDIVLRGVIHAYPIEQLIVGARGKALAGGVAADEVVRDLQKRTVRGAPHVKRLLSRDPRRAQSQVYVGAGDPLALRIVTYAAPERRHTGRREIRPEIQIRHMRSL